jgi:hypothetical protein
MSVTHSPSVFKLSSGGLIHWLLIHFHVQKPGEYSVRRRIILLCALTWAPLILWSAYEGYLVNHDITVSFIRDLKPYVRFLVVLPLLIAADTVIDPLIDSVISHLRTSGILPEDGIPAFERAYEILNRRKDSFFADVIMIIFPVLVAWGYIETGTIVNFYSEQSTWATVVKEGQYEMTYAGWWFLVVSSPVVQVTLYRWLWRFFIWCEFLYRVSRIMLVLEPTHPDLAGGLGILKYSQNSFLLIFFAFGAMLSVSFAQEILYTDATIAMVKPVVPAFVGLSLFISTLPLLFFSGQLIEAKKSGRLVYGALGYKLSRAFDEKWAMMKDPETGKNLLETNDSSTVCDYSTVYDVVKNMRFVPVTIREYIIEAAFLGLPFAPLVLLELPFAEVMSRLIDALI